MDEDKGYPCPVERSRDIANLKHVAHFAIVLGSARTDKRCEFI